MRCVLLLCCMHSYSTVLRQNPQCPPEIRLGMAACYYRAGKLPLATAAYNRYHHGRVPLGAMLDNIGNTKCWHVCFLNAQLVICGDAFLAEFHGLCRCGDALCSINAWALPPTA